MLKREIRLTMHNRYNFLYQVRDEDSQSVWTPGAGTSARGSAAIKLSPRNEWEANNLRSHVQEHLDWSSNFPSSLMSTYNNRDVAFDIAYGRKKKLGKQHVSVVTIDTRKVRGQMEFREMRRLARKLDVPIEDRAYHNSEHEWIILHKIPEDAIVDKEDI